MEPTSTAYELKLRNLMNDLQVILLDGKSVYEEGYVEDVRKRALKAERALQVLKNQIIKGEK